MVLHCQKSISRGSVQENMSPCRVQSLYVCVRADTVKCTSTHMHVDKVALALSFRKLVKPCFSQKVNVLEIYGLLFQKYPSPGGSA